MPILSRSLTLLIAAVAFGAHAQTIYKSIGPDGKTIYSDKPPASTTTKYDVVRPSVSSQPPSFKSTAKTAPDDTADTHPAASLGAKAGVHVRKPVDEAPPPATIDRQLEGAVIGVLGIDDLVRRTEDICTRALPTSYRRYSTAADGWRQRNAAVLSQARRVLSQAFALTERQNIETGLRAMNEQKFARVSDASMATKIGWCDRSTDEIARGAVDVHNNPKLAPPLMSYRFR